MSVAAVFCGTNYALRRHFRSKPTLEPLYSSFFPLSFRLHQDRTIPLMLLHLRFFVTVGLPKPTVEHFHCGVVHLLPTVKSATLAQGADGIREGVMQVVEEHLIPTVFTAEDESHCIVEYRPGALGVVCEELIPWMGVRKVGDEHPGRGKSATREKRNSKHKSPTLTERPTERISANKPHACPKANDKQLVCNTARKPPH